MTDRAAPTLWADWVTIWQSEMAALAADREMQEAVQRAADLWALHATLAVTPGGAAHDPAGRARPDAAAGAPTPDDALGGSEALNQFLGRLTEPGRT